MSEQQQVDETGSDELDLSALLAALAAGARAVQGLPLGEEDWSYQQAFPEVQSALTATSREWLRAVESMLLEEHLVNATDIHDPVLWEACADTCEALLEEVEMYLKQSDNNNNISSSSGDGVKVTLQQVSNMVQSKLGRMVASTVDMEKPQHVYNFKVQNSRTEPFVPPITEKPHAIQPLDLSLHPGHGLETRFGSSRMNTLRIPDDVIAPAFHVKHVYQTEIEALRREEVWEVLTQPPQSKRIAKVDKLTAIWVEDETSLQECAHTLSQVKEIAMDLEAHSFRSFAGFVCLMQISTRSQNYLIDTIKLGHLLNRYLGDVLADPGVVKVMHGADSDVAWLQRDFGLHVVNLFDTGRAARALALPGGHGYANLLKIHVQDMAVVDKSHQLADWRQRPLPDSMRQYAIQDTHYLLDIYDRLRWELQEKDLIQDVFEASRNVSLIRYGGEPFYPSGYQSLLAARGRRKTELSEKQLAALRALWDWRDAIARERDESLHYVCSNQNLMRMALSTPLNVTALQALFNPIPPIVMESAQELIELMRSAMNAQEMNDEEEEDEDEEVARPPVGAPSSAFFKPANEESRRRTMMSPVLGTEALYAQAGWMTPQEQMEGIKIDEHITSTEEENDDEDDPSKPKRMLSVHSSNQNFRSKQFVDHNMELGGLDGEERQRTRSVDGMGSVRAAREHAESPMTTRSVDDDLKHAKQVSARIKTSLAQKDSIPVVLGLISPVTEAEEEDVSENVNEEAKTQEGGDGDDTDEEFVIPRSMREIYKISNRNRRNKKAGSPTPERGRTPTSEKEIEELTKAEALLKETGAMDLYFEESPGRTGKRQRLKSTGRDSAESVSQDSSNAASREDDLQFMKEIGWIQGREDADRLMNQRYGGTGAGVVPSAPQAKPQAYAFDYSNVGPIGALPANPSSNPFFAGAAMAGGPLTQGKREQRKTTTPNKSKPTSANRRQQPQERPEKKDGRTHAYRKR